MVWLLNQRDARVGGLGRVADVMLHEPLDHRLVQWLGVGVLDVRRRIKIVVGYWIHQHLVQRRLPVVVARGDGDVGRHVAAGAFADQRDALGIATEFVRILQQPLIRRQRVVVRRRELVLGTLPVRATSGLQTVVARA